MGYPLPPYGTRGDQGVGDRPHTLGRRRQWPLAGGSQRHRSRFRVSSGIRVDTNEGSMKFRAVLFDAAETLFSTRGSVGEIYAGVARQFGSQAEPDGIQAAFARHFRGAGPLSVQ